MKSSCPILTLVAALIVGIQFAPAVRSQGPHRASFDAASIKPAAIPARREGGNRAQIQYTPTSLTMRNVSLAECVQWAYGVAFYQIAPGSSPESYEILAKAAIPTPPSQLRVMLQDLLAKRFQLALHRETKMLPVYELVIAKGGPRLPEPKTRATLPEIHNAESLPRVQGDDFVFAGISMPEFATMLHQLRGVDLPVIDRTGIPGTFDLTLKSGASVTRYEDVSALFAIIRDQLGLRLFPAKAPIEVIIIDHAEKPSEN